MTSLELLRAAQSAPQHDVAADTARALHAAYMAASVGTDRETARKTMALVIEAARDAQVWPLFRALRDSEVTP